MHVTCIYNVHFFGNTDILFLRLPISHCISAIGTYILFKSVGTELLAFQ